MKQGPWPSPLGRRLLVATTGTGGKEPEHLSGVKKRQLLVYRGETVLQQMNQRLQASATFEAAVATILADTVALHGAEFGNVQLAAGAKLIIVAEHRLRAPFLLAFREVRTTDGCACGRAWQTGEPIIVADVALEESYAPFREIAKEAGYRSVQSTPLIASNGMPLAMVSTHFANRYVPTKIEMAICKAYCTMAADRLQALLGASQLDSVAQKLHDALYADLGVDDRVGDQISQSIS